MSGQDTSTASAGASTEDRRRGGLEPAGGEPQTAPPRMTPETERAAARSPEFLAETRRLATAWLVAFCGLVGGTVAWIVLIQPPNAAWIWGQIVGLATFPGKYLIFSTLLPETPLTPWEFAVLALITDIVVALSLAVWLGWIARFPFVAGSLKRIHDRTQDVLANFPRLKRMAFWGAVLFVFLPLPASGAIGGTFFGQLVGLTRTAGVLAVSLGGALVSALFAVLVTEIGKGAEEIVTNKMVTGVSLVVFALFAWWVWRKMRAALREQPPPTPPSSDPR